MRNIDNSIKITWMIIGTVVVLALLGFYAFDRASGLETVQVQGLATVSVVPDVLKVYFNVETKGDSAKEAKDANALIVDKVVNSLVAEGIERDNIVTQNFNVYEDFDYTDKGQTSKGYKATHMLVVELSTDERDLIGDVIDAGIDGGAQLSYINYELSTELSNQYKAEALKLATQDARIKAEAMAEGLNARLGKIVSVSSQDFGYYPWRAYETAAMDSSVSGAKVETEIQPGEQDVSGSVTVVYKIR